MPEPNSSLDILYRKTSLKRSFRMLVVWTIGMLILIPLLGGISGNFLGTPPQKYGSSFAEIAIAMIPAMLLLWGIGVLGGLAMMVCNALGRKLERRWFGYFEED